MRLRNKLEEVLKILDQIEEENTCPMNFQIISKRTKFSQWTPPGTSQLNGVFERRNRTLLDMVWSVMAFTNLLKLF